MKQLCKKKKKDNANNYSFNYLLTGMTMFSQFLHVVIILYTSTKAKFKAVPLNLFCTVYVWKNVLYFGENFS